MGKNRHTKDRMFITATEWKEEYGGKKTSTSHGYQPLPFNHCALGLVPFVNPVCTPEGVLFDFENLAPYLIKHKKNPVTGEPMTTKQILRLNMSKNNEDEWFCPITFKVFNDNSHVVAIKTSGNVYSFDAVNELNLKPKSFIDLITGESFTKSDIITLQDPQNLELVKLRDINNFKHLADVRGESAIQRNSESTIRKTLTVERILKDIEDKKKMEKESGIVKKTISELLQKPQEDTSDISDFISLRPLSEDVIPGLIVSEQRAGGSMTSTVETVCTTDAIRLARPDEIREARYRKMRQLGKKGYAQIQTNLGNLNIEIHCDWAPRTSWNFLALCSRGYYDNLVFHRLVKDFMIQGGDPTGTGTGGESAWGPDKPFKDEFDSRLKHEGRGVLSMANAGKNTNRSQFFITFRTARHLDLVHCIFGRVVGGGGTLDRMEEVETDKESRPITEIKILHVEVFVNPISEADELLKADILASIQRREGSKLSTLLASSYPEDDDTVAGPESDAKSTTEGKAIKMLPQSLEASVNTAALRPLTGAVVTSNSTLTSSTATSVATSQKRNLENDVEKFLKSKSVADSTVSDIMQSLPMKKKKTQFNDFSAW